MTQLAYLHFTFVMIIFIWNERQRTATVLGLRVAKMGLVKVILPWEIIRHTLQNIEDITRFSNPVNLFKIRGNLVRQFEFQGSPIKSSIWRNRFSKALTS